ncbi:hypothetical protein PMZ80_009662 [Knufia obscura]|uniref:N-acetyltransferase domain-containing protein n=2 Tax=Knufia TaxID=430999 RepID=A0AAN8EGN4_9EURO|nr:hypothetical protein PMZ80_009662 [Knufia obscura]KAK5951053.1 hypothetical protein OHC33_007806 [Knufia fluminis]
MSHQPNTPTPPQVNRIDPNDGLSMNRFLDGIAAGFATAALSRAFITEIDSTPPPYPSPSINVPRLRRHITPGITDGAHSGAELVEAGDYSALAVWETTSYRGLPFSETLRDIGPIRKEWRRKVRQCKERYIGLETKEDGREDCKPCYHLGFLVRNPEQSNVKGAISAVVKPWLRRAEEEGVPVWLEATYEHAVDVYTHFGFRLVEVIRIGEGVRSAAGWPEEGGEGVCGFAMIYDGHLMRDG